MPQIAHWPKVTHSDIARCFTMSPRSYQQQGFVDTLRALQHTQAVTLSSPTGGGKSLIMSAFILFCNLHNIPVSLYTNRKLLTRQTAGNLARSGIEFGVRAASMPKHLDLIKPVQISGMQTEISRCIESDRWQLHDAGIILVDEAHMMATGDSLRVIQKHLAAGTKVVLVTATPIGLSHIAKSLVIAGTNSQLRQEGALVPALLKSLNQMDVSKVRRVRERYEYKSIIKECWSQAIVGCVYDDWKRFNPDARPTLGFAPGRPESRAMAINFNRKGVKAAHIDGTEVWVDGKYYKDDAEGNARNDVLARWRERDISTVWNCRVLVEAFDFPELYHLIQAVPFCSLKDYIQCVGRVLRWSEETSDYVLVTDHAGNYLRHGSPNQDIDWRELYELDEKEIREKRKQKKLDEPPEELPAACPQCGTTVGPGGRCPPEPLGCGKPIDETNPRKLRYVRQQSGEIKTIDDVTAIRNAMKRQKRLRQESREQKRWNELFFAARNSKSSRGMNFNQAKAMYERKYKQDLPADLALLPKDDLDWGRKIRDVDIRSLQSNDHD